MTRAAWRVEQVLEAAIAHMTFEAVTSIPATQSPKILQQTREMADPLSISASLLAILTAAVQSAKSLQETVRRYRGRDKTLQRLQDEVEDLAKVLGSLTKATATEESLLELLRGPVERCGQICQDFKVSMEVFGSKSKTGFRDWAKMEFMRGDISEFLETIEGYKSTISVGLGTIAMHNSKVSQHVLEDYNEMIKDTTYSLELHLQRIEEKMTQLSTEHEDTREASVDLEDERDVTRQCIRICDEARSYLQNMLTGASHLLNEASQGASHEPVFGAQVQVRQTLVDSQERLAQTASNLSRRLQALIQNPTSGSEEERLRLQSDLEISKQCLDVCSVARDITHQKVYRLGEVIADGDSDQVVVTTLADLFDVGKAVSKDSSAQLVGSMSADSLQHLTEKRYNSRFGALTSNHESVDVGLTNSKSAKRTSPQAGYHEHSTGRKSATKSSSNEMRKRVPEADNV